MTDRYRIIARDRDGKELARSDPPQSPDEWFDKYSNAASLTIERLPPEEAEPRRVWLRCYPSGLIKDCVYTSEEMASATVSDCAAVQFIEAKITGAAAQRAFDLLKDHGWIMDDPSNDLRDVRSALAAALGIEP